MYQMYKYAWFNIKCMLSPFSHRTRVANWEQAARSGPLWLPCKLPPPTPHSRGLLLLRPPVQLWCSSAAAAEAAGPRLLLNRKNTTMRMTPLWYSRKTEGWVGEFGLRESNTVIEREGGSLAHSVWLQLLYFQAPECACVSVRERKVSVHCHLEIAETAKCQNDTLLTMKITGE